MTDLREAELEALRILWETEEPLKPARKVLKAAIVKRVRLLVVMLMLI